MHFLIPTVCNLFCVCGNIDDCWPSLTAICFFYLLLMYLFISSTKTRFFWWCPSLIQGHKQWLAEVQFLRVVSHPNLVKLIGYCAVDGERGIQRLLVYEYMPNKSLEDHLFNRGLPNLPWRKRLEIILGAAEGLAYLHEGMEVQVRYTWPIWTELMALLPIQRKVKICLDLGIWSVLHFHASKFWLWCYS